MEAVDPAKALARVSFIFYLRMGNLIDAVFCVFCLTDFSRAGRLCSAVINVCIGSTIRALV